VAIRNPGSFECRRENVTSKLRMSPRTGVAANVDEGPNARLVEADQELVDAASSVTDRRDAPARR
jgi:hypothetical protein